MNNINEKDKQCVDFFKTGYIIAKTEELIGKYCDDEDVVKTYLDVKASDVDIEDIRDAFTEIKDDVIKSCTDSDEDCNDCDCCSSGDCDCDSEDDCNDIEDRESEDVDSDDLDIEDVFDDNFFKTGYYVGRYEEKFHHPMKDENIMNEFNFFDTTDPKMEFLRKACDIVGDAVSDFKEDPFEIEKVIFSGKATIVFWSNGEKSIVKCQKGDAYSQEEGLVMAICKMMYGNDNTFNDVINAAMKKAIVVDGYKKKAKKSESKKSEDKKAETKTEVRK